MIVVGKGEERNLTSSNSSKKDNREEVGKEREEAKRRILEENPHIAKDELEFVLSLPVERKIPSHGIGNHICNSRAARRNGKKTIEGIMGSDMDQYYSSFSFHRCCSNHCLCLDKVFRNELATYFRLNLHTILLSVVLTYCAALQYSS